MPYSRSPISQRVHKVTEQISRLRKQLSSKTRESFSSDFQYRSWLEKSHELISELENELSVLTDPGDYDQLPTAVVAEELGTTIAKVRLLIKGGEILASGKPAHEYISREEMAAACEIGMKDLLRRLGQDASEIFEESVVYLHQGQLQLAERACRRLIARESIVGTFALPYETSLLLVRADLDEIAARLRLIRRTEAAKRARFISNLRMILRGMYFQNEVVKAVSERLLYGDEERNLGTRKVLGSKLDGLQQLAMFITTVVLDEIDKQWKRPLRTSEREKLRRIIQSSVYSSLFAHDSYDRLASSREFINDTRALMPRYFEPASLIGGLVKDH